MTIATIGYEEVPFAAVRDTLLAAGIEEVVDVRAVAASRRPGFSKRQLAAGLDEAGISYHHLRGLGTPSEGRQAARSGRTGELFRIYEAHLSTPGAQADLAELIARVRGSRRICLLCYERHAERCHRQRVAELVCEALGIEARHLVALPV